MSKTDKVQKQAQFVDETIQESILNYANVQRKSCTFCDVVLKVYSREIYAHSNILSAASPYFEDFLAQDLPRCFSQRTAQIIEIQIEGSEQSQPFEDAVEEIIDYIYTGSLDLRQSNVAQVLEMSKIMKLFRVAKVCEEFILGIIGNAAICKVPSKGVMNSVAINTEWTGLKLFKEMPVLEKLVNFNKKCVSKSVQTEQQPKATVKPEKVSFDRDEAMSSSSQSNASPFKTVDDDAPDKHVYHVINAKESFVTRSGRKTTKLFLVNKFGEAVTSPKMSSAEETALPVVIEPSTADDSVDSAFAETEVDETLSDPTVAETSDHVAAPKRRGKDLNIISYVRKRLPPKKPKTYSCTECDYTTYSARMLSTHQMNHKFDEKICYYCDLYVEDADELAAHVNEHTVAASETPFSCRECSSSYKTRSLLNQHKVVHSSDKPYICEICSLGFKWKQSLTSHMNCHTKLKQYLCDHCGYATAWKAQLKAHERIHLGSTFKCERQGCTFETTKKQNLKFHELTHTGEKSNICDVCGQGFSLKRNMRRHMMLHFGVKQHKCSLCDFATSRLDKLKEHQLKLHQQGSPPERRLTIDDYRATSAAAVTTPGQFEATAHDAGQEFVILNPGGDAAWQTTSLRASTIGADATKTTTIFIGSHNVPTGTHISDVAATTAAAAAPSGQHISGADLMHLPTEGGGHMVVGGAGDATAGGVTFEIIQDLLNTSSASSSTSSSAITSVSSAAATPRTFTIHQVGGVTKLEPVVVESYQSQPMQLLEHAECVTPAAAAAADVNAPVQTLQLLPAADDSRVEQLLPAANDSRVQQLMHVQGLSDVDVVTAGSSSAEEMALQPDLPVGHATEVPHGDVTVVAGTSCDVDMKQEAYDSTIGDNDVSSGGGGGVAGGFYEQTILEPR